MEHIIEPQHLSLQKLASIIKSGAKLALSKESEARINKCREYLDSTLSKRTEPVYGVNTGFGSLCDVKIKSEDLETLQKNLVMSHACGMGETVPDEIVKLMLILKIKGLSYGNSGVQLITVQRLIDYYNNDIFPVVYTQGSLGASGDLAPLAHLSLPLLGEGEVRVKGIKMQASSVNKSYGWEPIVLRSKEGLALLNGTQFMSAYGSWSVMMAEKLADAAELIAAMSLDAYDGRPEPFYHGIHEIRPHAGQIKVAANMNALLEGSELINRKKEHVQDPYSFRCIPQVHGASRDAIAYVAGVMSTEISSVTDNPTVFPDEDLVISAGNFHGQPLALALDFLAIALAELGSISERRTYKLTGGRRDLPAFLVADPGLNSGFMIPQYTAASIVSQNKQYCTPCSVDTIDSSNGQEDHVSMGANAAVKVRKIILNLENILAIELLSAAQALDFRRPLKSSPKVEELHALLRSRVSFMDSDRILHDDMMKARDVVREICAL